MAQALNIENMSFEDALGELETIVRALESGKAPLEDSITAFEKGMRLKAHCETKLQDAQMKVEKITLAKDGSVTLENFSEKTNNQ